MADPTCIHPKLQLELSVSEAAFRPGEIGGWYACKRCGAKFSTRLRPFWVEVTNVGGEPIEWSADQ